MAGTAGQTLEKHFWVLTVTKKLHSEENLI